MRFSIEGERGRRGPDTGLSLQTSGNPLMKRFLLHHRAGKAPEISALLVDTELDVQFEGVVYAGENSFDAPADGVLFRYHGAGAGDPGELTICSTGARVPFVDLVIRRAFANEPLTGDVYVRAEDVGSYPNS